MRKKIKGISFIRFFIIIAVILVAVSLLSISPSGEKIIYSEFETLVEKGDIQEIDVEGNIIRALVVDTSISIDKFPETYDYRTTFLSIDRLMDLIDEYNEGKLDEDKIKANFDYASPSTLETIMPWLSILIFVFIGFIIVRSIIGANKKNMFFGKTKSKMMEKPDIRFSDVAGAVEEKEELAEIVDFLKNQKKYTSLGARIPKGILLMGSPGTGKTLLAKAIAGESSVPFFSISGSDFVEMFVGVGASRVRDLFLQAKMNMPCIIFIDEIDAVGRKRGAGLGGGNDEREQTLNQLLVEMDGFNKNDGIIVIAATNRPDVLDPALLRPGRFDRQIIVNIPDVLAREKILKLHSKNKPFSDDINFKALARLTSGFSGADIENLLNEAAILTARRNGIRISNKDLNEGFNKIAIGPKKLSHKMTDKDKKITAYHESGHTLVQKVIGLDDDVHEVSIIPRGRAGGYTLTRPISDDNYNTKTQLLNRIAVLMGGQISEKIKFNEITTGATNDIKEATKIASKMVKEYGMSDLGFIDFSSNEEVFIGRDYSKQQSYSESTGGLVDKEITKILSDSYNMVKGIITKNIDKLEVLTKLLLEKETVYKDEVDMVINGEGYKNIIDFINKRDELDLSNSAKEKTKRKENNKK